MDALDRVPVELELADDYGWKVNPTGAQLLERHWLLAGVAQSLEQPQLLSFNERHRPDSSPHSAVPVITAFLTLAASVTSNPTIAGGSSRP
jgi:hypothetical protein